MTSHSLCRPELDQDSAAETSLLATANLQLVLVMSFLTAAKSRKRMALASPRVLMLSPSLAEAKILLHSTDPLHAVRTYSLALMVSATVTDWMAALDSARVLHSMMLTEARLPMDLSRMSDFVPSLLLAPMAYWLLLTASPTLAYWLLLTASLTVAYWLLLSASRTLMG